MRKVFTAIGLLFFVNAFCQNNNGDLIPYLINNKFVFCNAVGIQKIKATFDYAEPFEYGYAIVSNENKFGVIDKTGNYIIPLKFREIFIRMSSNQESNENPYGIYFSINSDSIFYTRTGTLLKNKPPENIYFSVKSEVISYSIFELNQHFGFIYKSDTLIKPIYDNISKPVDESSILIVKKGNYYGIVTTDNSIVVPFNYSKITWDTKYSVFDLEQEGTLDHCYFDFRGASQDQVKLHCGYRKLIHNFYTYLLVENPDGKIFYIDIFTGKEYRK